MIVKISPTVTSKQRNDRRFVELLKQSEAFFNCRKDCCFNDVYRSNLCLHEGAHALFAKKAGATNIMCYGPEMFWDTRPEYNCPMISKSSVSYDDPRSGFSIALVKADLAGFICRREMTKFPNDQVAIDMDLAKSRQRFDHHVGTGDEAFKAVIAKAERSLLEDLSELDVREEVRAAGRQFEANVFPAPKLPPAKLTAAILRERRLGYLLA